MKRWKITRWVREEYEEYADTREEALEQIDDPATSTVTKETCVQEPL